jgi:hypothetical protein
LVTITGAVVAVIQLGIAAIPCGLYREWDVLLVTVCGTLLAWLMGFLQERSTQIRKNTEKTFVLTQGTGSRDAIVITGNGIGLDLEDLASDFLRIGERSTSPIAYALVMVVLWTALLITTSGIKSNTWYLFAIGGVGMLQNIYVAGATRGPESYGIYLNFRECIADRKVMSTLMKVEEKYPAVGRSLLPLLFPGPLREDEMKWWSAASEAARRPR